MAYSKFFLIFAWLLRKTISKYYIPNTSTMSNLLSETSFDVKDSGESFTQNYEHILFSKSEEY